MRLLLALLLLAAVCSGATLLRPNTRTALTSNAADQPSLLQSGERVQSQLQAKESAPGWRNCCLYEHWWYGGWERCYGNIDVPDIGFHDQVSSVRVTNGCWLDLFEHGGYGGASNTYWSDVGDMGWWNDRLSSFRCKCPIDCGVSAWTGWSACSAACGGGTQSRSRSVTQWNINNGAACPALSESQQCNTQACPRDCQVSEWSGWMLCGGAAECNGARAQRKRTVTVTQISTGAACPALQDLLYCNSPCNMCVPGSPNSCTSCQVGFDLVGNSCVWQSQGSPYIPLGCFIDQAARDLPANVQASSTVDPVGECAARCKAGLNSPAVMYIGLQFGGECWCGLTPPKYGSVPASECNMPCRSNSAVMCGASLRNSVYQVTNRQICRFYTHAAPPPETPTSQLAPEVFMVSLGGYTTPFSQAAAVCASYGNARVATTAEVTAAQVLGADWCHTGWVSEGVAMYPITTRIQNGCGGGSPGIKQWTPDSKLAATNCFGVKPAQNTVNILPFNEARWNQLTPEVFAVSLGGYTTAFSQAAGVCNSYGNARLATTSDLTAAWQAGADWCFTAWVSEGVAMYPINTRLVAGCGGGTPGIRNWTPDSKLAGTTCFGVKPAQGTANVVPFNEGRWNQGLSTAAGPVPVLAVRGTYESLEPLATYQVARSYRIPQACQGSVSDQFWNPTGGNTVTLTPGSAGPLANAFIPRSATCSCTACGERCSDCKFGKPDVCTTCNPQFKVDAHPEDGAVGCFPNPGPECCFYDRADRKGARICTRTSSDWVGYDFQEKFRYAKIEQGCEATIFQYWKQNKGGWSVKLQTGDNSWVDRNPRSYSCNCGAPQTATPPTPAPETWGKPVGDKATPTFERMGCFKDNTNGVRDLSTHYTRRMSGPADPEGWCAQFCFSVGGDYFGLQSADECWCGKNAPNQGQVAESECNVKCRGNDQVVCGGLDRNSVYRITKAPNPDKYNAAQQASGSSAPVFENDPVLAKGNLPTLADGREDKGTLFTYLGCFFENDGLPDLYENAIEAADMAPSVCLKNCNGFDVFGIREGLCVCGRSDWQPRWGYADETLCKACAADGGAKCGSNRQTSVYKLWV